VTGISSTTAARETNPTSTWTGTGQAKCERRLLQNREGRTATIAMWALRSAHRVFQAA